MKFSNPMKFPRNLSPWEFSTSYLNTFGDTASPSFLQRNQPTCLPNKCLLVLVGLNRYSEIDGVISPEIISVKNIFAKCHHVPRHSRCFSLRWKLLKITLLLDVRGACSTVNVWGGIFMRAVIIIQYCGSKNDFSSWYYSYLNDS